MSKEKQQSFASDSDNYRKMAEPYPTMANAQGSCDAFFEAVASLRKQHKVTNVYVVIKASALEDERERDFFLTGGFGNPLEFEGMLAYALGRTQHERQARIGEMLRGVGIAHHEEK